MVRHNSLSRGEPRYNIHLVPSHLQGQEGDCSKDGYAGSPPEEEGLSFLQEGSPAI